MYTQRVVDAPIHERGGQSSYLLLSQGQFGSRNLAITWVNCPPGSWQPLRQHDEQEQIDVITQGRGVMTVGDEDRKVEAGTMVFVPPATPHTIRNESQEMMSYVSATAPPFDGAQIGSLYRER